jgi:hypothetical protein
MAKKHCEQLTDRLHEHVARMTPDLTPEEVRHALRDAGTDPDRLRARLHERARACQCTARQGKARSSVSPASHRSHRPPEAHGRTQSMRWQRRQHGSKGLTQQAPIASNVQIARAYRKDGDLTKNDEDLLNALEADLRREAETE